MSKTFLEMFIEDCKYYDVEQKEVKTILKHVDLKGKIVLDIGAGIGRLAFPLVRHAKEVVAIDQDHRLSPYWKLHGRRNVKFVNTTAEQYLKNRRKFDVILLAWPTFDSAFIPLIKNAMDTQTLFIFLTCDNNSDWESVVDNLGLVKKGHFDNDISNKMRFLKELPRQFRLLEKKKMFTQYVYPDEKTALCVFVQDFRMWFGLVLDKKDKEKLKEIIHAHRKGRKVVFGEEVWFYVLKKKGGKHAG